MASPISAFLSALNSSVFDVILADYPLPQCTGMDALRAARQHCPDTPFLLVSGTIGEQAAIESLRSGATDYVLKLWPERLEPAVGRAVQEAREHAQRKRAEAELRQNEEEFRAMFELASIGMAQADVHTAQWVSGRPQTRGQNLKTKPGNDKPSAARGQFEVTERGSS